MSSSAFNPWTQGRRIKVTAAAILALGGAGATVANYAGWLHGSPGGRDTTAPLISITAPSDTATVTGASTPVTATCTDTVGCAGVQFKLDGANLQPEDTSAPFSITWNTTGANDGAHTLTAIARDAAGNTTSANSISVTVSNGGGGSPPVANEFVAATGSNGGVNCKRFSTPQIAPADLTTVCHDFQTAFAATVGGDTVEVMNGSYGAQSVFPNASVSSTVTFVPQDAASVTFTNVVQIKASYVELDNFHFTSPPDSTGLSSNIIIQPPNGGNGSFACISNDTLKNITGGTFAINNGTSQTTINGGTWNQDGFRLGGSAPDSVALWHAPAITASAGIKCPDSGTIAAPADQILITGAKFGDRFPACEDNTTYGVNPQSSCVAPTHPDCIHVYGPTTNMTIQNSWFDHCMGFDLQLNVDPTTDGTGISSVQKNVLVQNNLFGDDNHGSATSTKDCNGTTVSSQYVACASNNQILKESGSGELCDNVVYRNNTFSHDSGGPGANALFTVSCALAPGATVGVQFYNNFFQHFTGSCPSAPTVMDYNGFGTGSTCGTHTSTGSANFVQATDTAHDAPFAFASVPWTSDLHIQAGSSAINAGSCATTSSSAGTVSYAATDFGGASRPSGTCDVGAYVH